MDFQFILVVVIVHALSITSNVEGRPRLHVPREEFNLTYRHDIQGEVSTNTFYRSDYHVNFQNRYKKKWLVITELSPTVQEQYALLNLHSNLQCIDE